MCQDGRCRTNQHLKGSRPSASLSAICRLSHASGSIWPRTCFRFTPSSEGQGRGRQGDQTRPAACVFPLSSFLPDRDRGLQLGASLGARVDQTRPSRETDSAGSCEALRAAQQERRGRRGGDLRSGWASEHALRAGPNGREPVRIDASSRSRGAGGRSHAAAERPAWAFGRDRRHRAARGAACSCAEAAGRERRRRARRNPRSRRRARFAGAARSTDRRDRRGDRGDRRRAESVGEGRRQGSASDDHPRSRPGHGFGDRGERYRT